MIKHYHVQLPNFRVDNLLPLSFSLGWLFPSCLHFLLNVVYSLWTPSGLPHTSFSFNIFTVWAGVVPTRHTGTSNSESMFTFSLFTCLRMKFHSMGGHNCILAYTKVSSVQLIGIGRGCLLKCIENLILSFLFTTSSFFDFLLMSSLLFQVFSLFPTCFSQYDSSLG